METGRLRLRPFRAEDLEPQAAMLVEPEVYRHLGGKPSTREEVWRKLLSGPGMWAFMGFGYWAVERKQDGALIGQVGFGDFKRAMSPAIEGLPEMGWLFASEAHGKGYASEAVAAGLSWADRMLAGRDIVAVIDAENLPSVRLAERAGFSERTEAIYNDEPTLLFRRRSP